MICPQCQNDVVIAENNFGALYTCPSCQAVYFINFEGQPEYSEMQSSSLQPQVLSDELVPPPLSGDDALMPPDSLYQLSNPFELPVEPLEESTKDNLQDFAAVASEIESFGNSDAQTANLNYDLIIKGLDTKDVLSQFREAISDSRFGWEPSDVVKQIKKGELKLDRVNPVAAFILAKRLKFLDLELKWTQNVLQ